MWVVDVVSGGLLLLHTCRATRRAVIWGSSPVISSPLVTGVGFDELVLTRPVDLSFSNDDNFVTIELPC